MEIYMVGVHKKGKDIVGYRMLSLDSNGSTEVKDVDCGIVLVVLKQGTKIHNIKVERNRIKGSNGSLDRYGVVNKSQSIVVLKEIHNHKDEFIGYLCSDALGNTKMLSEKDVVSYAERIGIANGKVVTNSNGDKHISSIEGNYSIIKQPSKNEVKAETVKQTEQSKVDIQNNNADELYFKALKIIEELAKHKEYENSFARKVAASVMKYKKCSDKQLKILKDEYDKLNTAKKNVTTERPVEKPVEPENIKEEIVDKKDDASINIEQKPENKELEKPKLSLIHTINIGKPELNMDDVLIYQLMKNGQVYVKGIVDDKKYEVKTLVIPETTVLEGKTYKVTGINMGAFIGTYIESVKTSKNILDIGQEAFLNCVKLKEVDLSESKHTHLAMNMFRGCRNLRDINAGNFVQRIHEGAFHGCTSLEYFKACDLTDTIARNAFFECNKLVTFEHKAKFINDSAFRGCRQLENFDFSTVNVIGSYAFRDSGFKSLTIPGNVNNIGNKAFADCLVLETVTIEEGVQEIGEYCFAKPRYADVKRQYRQEMPYSTIKTIMMPKSVISILNGAFLHVDLVKVWTGSVAESHCIGFNIPYERLDEVNLDNSTKVRVKSAILGANPIEALYSALKTESPGSSNPDFLLNEKKLVNIDFNDSQLEFFGIPRTSEIKEPHIKFKAIVNYLQDVSTLYQAPLSQSTLRLQDTFYVISNNLYDDGCNRIYKVTYRIMDTLDEGCFIMVLMNNKLRYITECNIHTDIELENTFDCNDVIPVNKFLHAGDTIGKQGTIDGCMSIITDNETSRRVNVGEMLLNRLKNHGITFKITKRDSILYLPACNLALNLHDGRIWDRPGVISRDTKDCINLIGILNYDEMKELLIKSKKSTYNMSKLFDELSKLSTRDVELRNKNIATIEDEKEAQLFRISKKVRDIVINSNSEDDLTPNLLTPDVFFELSNSYWMVSKDVDWLRSAGTKSLNKINEYTIGKYRLFEYKSNQIVKFSNPYMNGQKGAYVFTLMQNSNIVGVYASRYNMNTLFKKLYDLTDMTRYPSDQPIPELMTSAEHFDKISPYLFYHFYDVLQSKNGWNFSTFLSRYSYGASFHISMYKPTGIFYLTLERVAITEENKGSDKEKTMRSLRIIPLLPIGNMDRALMVATTTNTNAKDSQLLKELMAIMNIEEIHDNNMRLDYKVSKEELYQYRNNYIQARQLVIDRVKDVSQYKKLIDDRAVYMLGTLHSGVLQREYSSVDFEDELDIDIDITEDIVEQNNIEVDSSDDFDIDIDEEEIDFGTEEIDIDYEEGEEPEEVEISEEDFIEAAREQGITDLNVIRAMYLNFKNSR